MYRTSAAAPIFSASTPTHYPFSIITMRPCLLVPHSHPISCIISEGRMLHLLLQLGA